MVYNPRICSRTERPISSADKNSIQMTFVTLSDEGRAGKEKIILNFSGEIRESGSVDDFLNTTFAVKN